MRKTGDDRWSPMQESAEEAYGREELIEKNKVTWSSRRWD
jgi:hypothetical protein